MSQEERAASAARAAAARWGAPKVAWEGTLEIGEISFKCGVFEENDGKVVRVISETEMMKALGMYRSGALSVRRKDDEAGGAQIPLSLAYKNLKPFIEKNLGDVHYQPRKVIFKNGSVGHGMDAELLLSICEVWIDAAKEGVLGPRQAIIAKAAETLHRGLARVGVAAMIDEATGYQDSRAKGALADILRQYVAEDFRRWTECFPEKFYREMFRLKGWDWTEKSIAGKRPGVVGRYTDDIVYERLAPGVLEELRNKNPSVRPGRRRHKHYYWLTGEVGHPKLLAHLEGVWLLMKQSKDWDELKDKLDEYYPIHEVTENGMTLHVKRRKIGSKR